MRKFVQAAVREIDGAQAAISWEPDVIADFQELSIERLPPVLIAVMNLGCDDAARIVAYLHERNCQISAQTIEYVLALFEGKDEATCLWTQEPDGTYTPIERP